MPFLRCGFAHDDVLLAVTSAENVRLLRDALGGDLDPADDTADADATDRYCHPAWTLASGTTCPPDRSYTGSAEPAVRNHRGELPEPPISAHVSCFGQHDLAKLRHLVAERAHRAGTQAQQIAELVFLVHEVAFTVVEQVGGKAALRIWRSGDHLTYQVTSQAVSSGGPFADCTCAANYLLGESAYRVPDPREGRAGNLQVPRERRP